MTAAFAALLVALGLVTLSMAAAQPAVGADLHGEPLHPAVERQTNPEPPEPNNPGEVPGEGALPAGQADAEGASATPWVAVAIAAGVLLVLAGVIWSSRRSRVTDADLHRSAEPDRSIPPGPTPM